MAATLKRRREVRSIVSSRHTRVIKPSALLALTATLGMGMSDWPGNSARAAVSAAAFDFNGDGRVDLVLAAPGEAVTDQSGDTIQGAGQVHVIFGAADGGLSRSDIVLNGATEIDGIRGRSHDPTSGGGFGSALVSADFDRDGYADLAVGEPYGGLFPDEGRAYVYYGGPSGFRSADLLGEAFGGTDPAPGDHFGASLATGDFNADGFADLAVGAPDKPLSGHPRAGVVVVDYGQSDGVTTQSTTSPGVREEWDEDSTDVPDRAANNERFGSSLVAGDVDGDGLEDLVVGISGEYVGGIADTTGGKYQAGAVQPLRGTSAGLTAQGEDQLSLDSPGIKGVAESRDGGAYPEESDGQWGDRFGATLVSGDFDNDGFDDIVVGVPDKQVVGTDSVQFHGAISVLYGGATLGERNRYLTEATSRVPGQASKDWQFAAGLAAADLNRDGYDDLAVGAPANRHVPGIPGAGSVTVLFGGRSGVVTADATRLTPASPGIPGRARANDQFGCTVQVLDVFGGRADDLVIGVPGDRIGASDNAGAAVIVPGGRHGLREGRASRLTENTRGIRDAAEPGDRLQVGGPTNWTTGQEGETV